MCKVGSGHTRQTHRRWSSAIYCGRIYIPFETIIRRRCFPFDRRPLCVHSRTGLANLPMSWDTLGIDAAAPLLPSGSKENPSLGSGCTALPRGDGEGGVRDTGQRIYDSTASTPFARYCFWNDSMYSPGGCFGLIQGV